MPCGALLRGAPMSSGRTRASANPATGPGPSRLRLGPLPRLTATVATLALLPFLLALPPARVAAAAPLPACRYADVPALYANPADWQRTLVDPEFTVGAGYTPTDLVPVSEAGIGGGGEIRAIVIGDLRAMTAQAKADGAAIAVQSAYRSYPTQEVTFNYWVGLRGYQAALLASARPGHSEHQLGTAIDFRSADTTLPWTSDWQQTPAGAWMAANAWRYGFVMSYPAASSPAKTCYDYEPWHYRYVGRAEAAAMHASGLSPREYLWSKFGSDTAAKKGSVTAATSTPSPAASATLQASAEPDPAVAAVPAPTPPAPPGALLPMLSLLAAAGLLLWSPARQRRLTRWLMRRSSGWRPAARGTGQAERVRGPAGRGDASSWTSLL